MTKYFWLLTTKGQEIDTSTYSIYILYYKVIGSSFTHTLKYLIIVPMKLAKFLGKNLDQCFVIIFDKCKLFLLIDLTPDFTSYRGPGIKSIN